MARGGSRFGAGRPASHVKAEHCLRLDVRDLARRKLLDGSTFSWRWSNNATGEEVGAISISTRSGHACLTYTHNGTPICDGVSITHTACTYGGARPWFMCPRCDRRAGVLFMRSGRFMCRDCGRVAYASQSEDEAARTWRRQSKLESRLGADWQRLKGMHHATRARICDAIIDCERRRDAALLAFAARSGLLAELGW